MYRALVALLVVALWTPVHGDTIRGMQVVGYGDRLSVQPGETIRFMVSSELPGYRADIVRLIHGDTNPNGPGFKEELIETPANKEYVGRHQDLPSGSYVMVPDSSALRRTGSFTIQAWIAPSTPGKGVQGIVTKWSPADRTGYGLFVDEDGSLGLWLGEKNGQVQKVRTAKPLRASVPANVWPGGHQMVNTTTWYFVAASFDASIGRVTLYQAPQADWPGEETRAVVEKTVPLKSVAQNDVPLLIGAAWYWRDAERTIVGSHYNGKIENPRLVGRALTKQEIEGLQRGAATAPRDGVAAWDFSADISSRRVTDTSPNKLNGQTVNMPTRAMTGHNWKAYDNNHKMVPQQYGAIYFHDDDLDDAAWKVDFEYQVPATLKSGIYAARLRAGNGEDYVPFFVRPKKGTTTNKIAFLVPTFSYLAYGNIRSGVRDLLSLYDHHSDGSGVCYSSRLRPILNMRPKIINLSRVTGISAPHQLNADLHLIDWMEVKGYHYDVITDEDLDVEGEVLLKPYKVIVTGSHPEYWSGPMLDGMQGYLEKGGRLMYLGGNGFYWVTSMDSEGKHTVEIRRRDGTETWEAAPGEYYHSTTGEFGGLWRFRGRPPQQLVGVGFSAQGGDKGVPFRRQPGSLDPRASWIFDGIGPDELIGDHFSLVLGWGAAGSEVDRADSLLGTPPHALVLATATGFSDVYQHVVEEVLQSGTKEGGTVSPWVKGDMIYFEYPNNGAVFSSSSISWDGSLSYNNYDNAVSKVTGNVLKRFSSDQTLPGRRPTTDAEASRGRGGSK
jgi:N,N-dimethylformamidase